ncbi:hypothetical protein ABE021_01370 [Sporosarcina gallistercoris]|uniref:hypothetical protein n=1 Tax=Sporosarcina gallistercoris TaxID=2762245 RepID=UPI003D2AA703
MKPYTDDEMIEKLETLSEAFHPTHKQKESMHATIFQQKNKRKKRSPLQWKPALISLLLLVTFVSAVTLMISKPDSHSLGFFAKDVTKSWNHVVMKQESSNDLTSYYLYFDEDTLHIQNVDIGSSLMGSGMSESEIQEAAADHQTKLAKMTLQEGEYPNYTVKKKKNLYEITVSGNHGFTYTLEKTAPRKYTGEDGIRYSTGQYIE